MALGFSKSDIEGVMETLNEDFIKLKASCA